MADDQRWRALEKRSRDLAKTGQEMLTTAVRLHSEAFDALPKEVVLVMDDRRIDYRVVRDKWGIVTIYWTEGSRVAPPEYWDTQVRELWENHNLEAM
jgi:hypothetical protein